MKKKKSFRALAAAAMVGMLFQFGGCNFQQLLWSTADEFVFSFIEPFVADLTGGLFTPAE